MGVEYNKLIKSLTTKCRLKSNLIKTTAPKTYGNMCRILYKILEKKKKLVLVPNMYVSIKVLKPNSQQKCPTCTIALSQKYMPIPHCLKNNLNLVQMQRYESGFWIIYVNKSRT